MISDDEKSRLHVNRMGLSVIVILLLILGFLAGALVYAEIPDKNQNAMLVLIGIIATNVGVVVNWLFGTSVSSKKQQDTIADMAHTAKSAQAALPANPSSAIPIHPGETVAVKAEPAVEERL